MENWSHLEAPIRLSMFAGLFLLFAALEAAFPAKRRTRTRGDRWPANLSMIVFGSLITRFLVPVGTIALAGLMQEKNFGLFNWLDVPIWLEIILAIIAFDLVIWAQHVLSHQIPLLWAVHRYHHTDEDLDVSSGVRFHPIELAYSAAIKLGAIILLGPAPIAVFLFELILNAASLFEHTSLAMPKPVERFMRYLIVTPDMHRIHHSVRREETNSNYGFCLSIWDRMFGTYCHAPRDGQKAMRLGLDERPEGDTTNILWGIISPFRRSAAKLVDE